MKLDPYLIFNGTAEKAILFYCNALEMTHSEMKRYQDSPMLHEEYQKNWIIHCELMINNETVAMVADAATSVSGTQIQLSLNYTDLNKMEKDFANLAKEGNITSPLEKQFWNATFGQLIDQFGVHWMMNFDHENL